MFSNILILVLLCEKNFLARKLSHLQDNLLKPINCCHRIVINFIQFLIKIQVFTNRSLPGNISCHSGRKWILCEQYSNIDQISLSVYLDLHISTCAVIVATSGLAEYLVNSTQSGFILTEKYPVCGLLSQLSRENLSSYYLGGAKPTRSPTEKYQIT